MKLQLLSRQLFKGHSRSIGLLRPGNPCAALNSSVHVCIVTTLHLSYFSLLVAGWQRQKRDPLLGNYANEISDSSKHLLPNLRALRIITKLLSVVFCKGISWNWSKSRGTPKEPNRNYTSCRLKIGPIECMKIECCANDQLWKKHDGFPCGDGNKICIVSSHQFTHFVYIF